VSFWNYVMTSIFLNVISTLTVRNRFTYDDRQFDIEASPIYSRIGLHVIWCRSHETDDGRIRIRSNQDASW
jgi:hypothetical protein